MKKIVALAFECNSWRGRMTGNKDTRLVRAVLLAVPFLLGAQVSTSLQASAQDAATVERMTRESLLSLLGTTAVEAKRDFKDGQLIACTVEFNALAQDRVYRQGAYISVGGYFGLMSNQGVPSAVLRVTVHDLDSRTMKFTPSPPASAYFVSGYSTTKNAIVNSSPSDMPGAIFVIFHLHPTLKIIVDGLVANKVTIAFARTKGGTDIQVPIDTSVVDTAANGQRTRSPKASFDFFECSKLLLEETTKALGHTR
jgi:hypothetical protein